MVSTLGRSHVLLCLIAVSGSVALAQQENPAAATKVGVIDVQRLVLESQRGRVILDQLKNLREQKAAEGEIRQQEIQRLQGRLQDAGSTLSEEGLADLEKDLEEKIIEFRRFADDAERVLEKEQDDAFARIEREVMPIIDRVGREQGFTLLFNKYESGLVFAADEVDITGLILELYDQSVEGES
jgi:outer membrane protein